MTISQWHLHPAGLGAQLKLPEPGQKPRHASLFLRLVTSCRYTVSLLELMYHVNTSSDIWVIQCIILANKGENSAR
jgi:hypothetical protein